VIDFNFNIFCGTPNDISRRSSVPRRIVWELLTNTPYHSSSPVEDSNKLQLEPLSKPNKAFALG